MDFDESSIWIVMIIGIALYTFISSRIDNMRTQALERIAKKKGFSFEELNQADVAYREMDFELFRHGRSRYTMNEMKGCTEDGYEISVFDYHRSIPAGKDTIRDVVTVLSLKCNNELLPNFFLRPEGIFEKASHVFGYSDIDFEAHPQFSKKYYLVGEDEEEIRRLFSEQILKFFEENTDLNIEVRSGTFIFYVPSKVCGPERIDAFIQQGKNIFLTLLS